ncbi:CinA family protein [Halarcobacter ebronensis]|uniref:Damage-inducible protein CinA n=1 Tax=Halarcobacter ebronensis TaxID=1462615 RepID=A0A4Q1AHJ6_9BACT|nr:CinA family protein [Halarcobacter ebronensis]QKF81203.1 NMN amidohydrolase [Halarcobacter ebronensis]RXK03222.1 damage-inducible protein CinA [Halarcobacter ebronensis]
MKDLLYITQEELIEFQNLLRENKKTITTAESCTGGLIASSITQISGSSDIFNGAVITYSNEIKSQELKVKKETLEKFGAVSKEVVEEMLDGVINKFNADFAIAVSGIAGPNGGTKNKPVGTVVIGISSKENKKEIEVCLFDGTRSEVQNKAAKYSLKKLFNFFQKSLDK